MRSNLLLKSAAAVAATCALWAGSAQAATIHNLALTGAVASGSSSFQIIGPTRYDQFFLDLQGLDALNSITVEVGDTINATITLDTLLTVPQSVDLTTFVFIASGDMFPGGDTGATGSFDFYDGMNLVRSTLGGATTTGQIANAVVYYSPNNGPFSFDSLTTSFVIDELSGPATLDRSLIGYTLFSPSGVAAVPEPATWAMMIIGFGGVGMLMRRRRGGGLAAFA